MTAAVAAAAAVVVMFVVVFFSVLRSATVPFTTHSFNSGGSCWHVNKCVSVYFVGLDTASPLEIEEEKTARQKDDTLVD